MSFTFVLELIHFVNSIVITFLVGFTTFIFNLIAGWHWLQKSFSDSFKAYKVLTSQWSTWSMEFVILARCNLASKFIWFDFEVDQRARRFEALWQMQMFPGNDLFAFKGSMMWGRPEWRFQFVDHHYICMFVHCRLQCELIEIKLENCAVRRKTEWNKRGEGWNELAKRMKKRFPQAQ